MKCPICKEVNLVISERQGIEIDYCPECRGVWLDRGELDKIIEKSENQINSINKNTRSEEYSNNRVYSEHNDNNINRNSYEDQKNSKYNEKDRYNNQYNNHKVKKKESFISNVFDIFGD